MLNGFNNVLLTRLVGCCVRYTVAITFNLKCYDYADTYDDV